MMDDISRRDFLKKAGGAALAAGMLGGASAAAKADPASARPTRRVSPGEKVVVGVVGVAGRGYGAHMHTFGGFPDVEIGAVCDVYDKHLDRAVAFTNGKAKP